MAVAAYCVYYSNRSAKVAGAITSLTLRGNGTKVGTVTTHTHSSILLVLLLQFFVGTATAQMYQIDSSDMSVQFLNSCHYDAITDICFPR